MSDELKPCGSFAQMRCWIPHKSGETQQWYCFDRYIDCLRWLRGHRTGGNACWRGFKPKRFYFSEVKP